MRREILTWDDVDQLIDKLTPQFHTRFEAMVMITRGGIVPGGLLAEALDIKSILTASVNFVEIDLPQVKLAALPSFLQFPDDHLLEGRKILIVDDVWGSGRTITAVKDKIESAQGMPSTCVLHYNPYRALFTKAEPTYYAAVTDAHIVYPWELDRGVDPIMAREPLPMS
ncbi:MAG: phosphoribosyltransferase [Chloroflexi bacterium]|nr:phosphoribosyltransferase [Chloroflexota bacterium]